MHKDLFTYKKLQIQVEDDGKKSWTDYSEKDTDEIRQKLENHILKSGRSVGPQKDNTHYEYPADSGTKYRFVPAYQQMFVPVKKSELFAKGMCSKLKEEETTLVEGLIRDDSDLEGVTIDSQVCWSRNEEMVMYQLNDGKWKFMEDIKNKAIVEAVPHYAKRVKKLDKKQMESMLEQANYNFKNRDFHKDDSKYEKQLKEAKRDSCPAKIDAERLKESEEEMKRQIAKLRQWGRRASYPIPPHTRRI